MTRFISCLILLLCLGNASATEDSFPIGNIDLKDIDELEGGSAQLPPEQAFSFSGVVWDGQQLLMRWDVAPGHYLYRGKFKVLISDRNDFRVGNLILPEGKIKEDEFFGTIQALYGEVNAALPFTLRQSALNNLVVKVGWQGCSEQPAVCYPPEEKFYLDGLSAETVRPLQLKQQIDSTHLAEYAELFSTLDYGTLLSEQDRIAGLMANNNRLWTMLIFLGFGLLLAFTPCVLPMVPILSGVIVGQKNIDSYSAFALSSIYVLAMSLTYTLAGVLAGLFGANLQAALQHPGVIITFSLIFIVLALSMFGLYELQLPSALQTKLNLMSNRQTSGKFFGVAVMGVLSALIVGPCVAAPLAGTLIYIGQTGDAILGGLALFALSFGMGIPLLVVGTSAGKLLPKAGKWMEVIKWAFGFMLLAVAIWMLERIFPSSITLALWAALLIFCAHYLGVFKRFKNPKPINRSSKALGVLLLGYSIVLIAGSATGGGGLFSPLHGFSNRDKLEFQPVDSLDELKLQTTTALSNPILLDFYAHWCVSCKEMEKYTFSDPTVQKVLKNFSLLKADVTKNTSDDQQLMQQFDVFGPPALVFFSSKGEELRQLRVVGYLPPEDFIDHIKRFNSLN